MSPEREIELRRSNCAILRDLIRENQKPSRPSTLSVKEEAARLLRSLRQDEVRLTVLKGRVAA